ncbi:MAG: ATP-binding protein, partial [Myxococcota bacterium]|nr:ATP-binding protein [Myxococcota bacterium]
KGASLELELEPCPQLLGHRSMVRDALNNLLSNSLKYRREDVPGRCILSVRHEGSWVILTVTDNGLGVPEDQRERIFDPFVRIEDAKRERPGGHGLGLSIVADTVRQHSGSARCMDGMDGGARFELRLRIEA